MEVVYWFLIIPTVFGFFNNVNDSEYERSTTVKHLNASEPIKYESPPGLQWKGKADDSDYAEINDTEGEESPLYDILFGNEIKKRKQLTGANKRKGVDESIRPNCLGETWMKIGTVNTFRMNVKSCPLIDHLVLADTCPHRNERDIAVVVNSAEHPEGKRSIYNYWFKHFEPDTLYEFDPVFSKKGYDRKETGQEVTKPRHRVRSCPNAETLKDLKVVAYGLGWIYYTWKWPAENCLSFPFFKWQYTVEGESEKQEQDMVGFIKKAGFRLTNRNFHPCPGYRSSMCYILSENVEPFKEVTFKVAYGRYGSAKPGDTSEWINLTFKTDGATPMIGFCPGGNVFTTLWFLILLIIIFILLLIAACILITLLYKRKKEAERKEDGYEEEHIPPTSRLDQAWHRVKFFFQQLHPSTRQPPSARKKRKQREPEEKPPKTGEKPSKSGKKPSTLGIVSWFGTGKRKTPKDERKPSIEERKSSIEERKSSKGEKKSLKSEGKPTKSDIFSWLTKGRGKPKKGGKKPSKTQERSSKGGKGPPKRSKEERKPPKDEDVSPEPEEKPPKRGKKSSKDEDMFPEPDENPPEPEYLETGGHGPSPVGATKPKPKPDHDQLETEAEEEEDEYDYGPGARKYTGRTRPFEIPEEPAPVRAPRPRPRPRRPSNISQFTRHRQ